MKTATLRPPTPPIDFRWRVDHYRLGPDGQWRSEEVYFTELREACGFALAHSGEVYDLLFDVRLADERVKEVLNGEGT